MSERIKELAEEAGFDKHHTEYDTRIERFAELVRQDEREACAKIADSNRRNMQFLASDPPQSAAAWDIAVKIRRRTE
jgi:hypothetical protein